MAEATLPVDIISAEILPRLPTNSLIRFKSVSKFFQTLISTPEFIRHHLHHSLSSDTDRHLILVGKSCGLYTFSLDSPESSAVSLRFPDGITEGSGGGLFLVGSCNGLVCAGMPLSSLILFNLLIGIYKKIDDSEIAFVPNCCINYGFGFDDVNDDYKIVRIMTYYEYLNRGMRREVRVYSLNSNSWNLVNGTSLQDSLKHMENGVVINGHLVHWRFWNPSTNNHRISCFDIRDNRWIDDVPLPDYNTYLSDSNDVHFADCLFHTYRNKHNDLIDLGVFDGCLCLLTEKPFSYGVDIWMLTEYGLKESWINLVESFGNVDWPLMICPFTYAKGSRCEILIREDLQSNFLWYNFRDSRRRLAEIYGAPPYSDACIFNGSLVRPSTMGRTQNESYPLPHKQKK